MLVFIQSDITGYAYVGYCLKGEVWNRLAFLQDANCHRLRLVGARHGTIADKLAIRLRLAGWHIRNDWYEPGGPVSRLLREVEVERRRRRRKKAGGELLADRAREWVKDRFQESPVWSDEELTAAATAAGLPRRVMNLPDVMALPIRRRVTPRPGGGSGWVWYTIDR